MRVRLLKSWINTQGRKYPKGTVLSTDESLGFKLIKNKYGVLYDGEYPNVKKMRTNFKEE